MYWEGLLEEGMATRSSVVARRIPWSEEPGGLQSGGHTESDTTEPLTLSLCKSKRRIQKDGFPSFQLPSDGSRRGRSS